MKDEKKPLTVEQDRLRTDGPAWKHWGPYLSERQWGTVREDYSDNGDAWNYFTHDHARSRAYRWGEDGLAGISDDKQRLCFALALWNGKDPILKERLFGLTNSEGNHGEDVKEYYFYLDSTPTHSYMKYLYKYPQAAFPYDDLGGDEPSADREEMEYELLDTGVFDDDRYFDVFVEYAKDGPEDLLVRITVGNRGPEAASLHRPAHALVSQRLGHMVGETAQRSRSEQIEPQGDECGGMPRIRAWRVLSSIATATRRCCLPRTKPITNGSFGIPNASPYVKDGINNYVVNGQQNAVNPARPGPRSLLITG